MMKTLLLLLFFLLFFSGPTPAKDADVRLMLADIAGISMANPEERGMGRELVEQALSLAGLSYTVEFLPWPRLINVLPNIPNALMLPLSWSKEREAKYKWIRPIFTAEIGFVSLHKELNEFEAAHSISKIGVWEGTIFQQELMKRDFRNVYPFKGDEHLGKLFESGRIHAWYGELNESRYRLKKYMDARGASGLAAFYFGQPVHKTQAWLVGGLGFDPQHIVKIKAALDMLYETGQAQAIYQKYYSFKAAQ